MATKKTNEVFDISDDLKLLAACYILNSPHAGPTVHKAITDLLTRIGADVTPAKASGPVEQETTDKVVLKSETPTAPQEIKVTPAPVETKAELVPEQSKAGIDLGALLNAAQTNEQAGAQLANSIPEVAKQTVSKTAIRELIHAKATENDGEKVTSIAGLLAKYGATNAGNLKEEHAAAFYNDLTNL